MRGTVAVIWAARVSFVAAGLLAPIALVVGLAPWFQAVALACVVLWAALASYYADQAARAGSVLGGDGVAAGRGAAGGRGDLRP